MLIVHRADRADSLLATLAELLATPLPDPFAAEVVAVPTRGIERWLTQGLALELGTSPGGRDGVVANVDFPSPRAVIDRAVAAACGVDPERDPWAPARTLWPLLDVVDGALDEPWLATLAQHLAGSATGRLGAVRHLATLFDRYALQRPAMVRAWHAGHDVDAAGRPLARTLAPAGGEAAAVGAPDGGEAAAAGAPDGGEAAATLALDGGGTGATSGGGAAGGGAADVGATGAAAGGEAAGGGAAWQAQLWRALRERIGTPSPAERLECAAQRLVEDPGLSDLPERLAVFGLTRLPAAHVAILRALAVHRDVHLLLLHPSPCAVDPLRPAARPGRAPRHHRSARRRAARLHRSALRRVAHLRRSTRHHRAARHHYATCRGTPAASR